MSMPPRGVALPSRPNPWSWKRCDRGRGTPNRPAASAAPPAPARARRAALRTRGRGPRQPHLAQLVLLLHLAQLVQVAEPGGHVQPPVRALLRVRLRGRQLGAADGELHAGLLVRHALAGTKAARSGAPRAALEAGGARLSARTESPSLCLVTGGAPLPRTQTPKWPLQLGAIKMKMPSSSRQFSCMHVGLPGPLPPAGGPPHRPPRTRLPPTPGRKTELMPSSAQLPPASAGGACNKLHVIGRVQRDRCSASREPACQVASTGSHRSRAKLQLTFNSKIKGCSM